MLPAQSLLFPALCALSTVSASLPVGAPAMAIEIRSAAVGFHVKGPDQEFLGAVIASLSPDLRHYLVDLPPLLADFVVLGAGLGKGLDGYQLLLPHAAFPAGQFVYCQGVTFTAAGIEATDVGEFVLDVTVGGGDG